MLFGLTFFIQFLIGGLSGIFVASPVLDYQAYGTYIIVAHFHYTLFAGSIFGFFAGVYHWFPKITGALLRERLGKLHWSLMVIGTNLTFFPMFFLGQRRDAAADLALSHAPGLGDAEPDSRRSAPGSSRSACSSSWSTCRSRCAGACRPATTRGSGTRSSGRPPRRRRRSTSSAPLPPIRSYAPLLDLREAGDGSRARARRGDRAR